MAARKPGGPARAALIGALALAAGGVPAFGQPAQSVHRRGFVPVGDAAFAIVAQFYDLDPGLPMNPRVVDTWEEGAGRYEKVVFTTQSGERVPGTLALPAAAAAPHPCVLLLHGLGNSKDRWWEEDRAALPAELLGAGIAVFAIDLRYHGERSVGNDYQPPVYLTLGDSLFVRNRDMMVQSAVDARRALAYLRGRGDIDTARIAVMGYSMGAMISVALSALEPRLAAVVVTAMPTGDQPAPIDPFNFAPRSKVPALLQFGRTDWMSAPEDAETLRRLMGEKHAGLRFYDAGHRLPPAFATDAAAWLRARLK